MKKIEGKLKNFVEWK